MQPDLTSHGGNQAGTIVLRRRIVNLWPEPGAGKRLGLAQRFEVKGAYHSTLITAQHWFASMVYVRQGRLHFQDGRGVREMETSRFLLFLPAGSLVRMPLVDAHVDTRGITGQRVPFGWPSVPVAIPCDLDEDMAVDEAAVSRVLQRDTREFCIDADIGVSKHARLLRKRLHDVALSPSPVGQIATELGTSMSVLSRRFSSGYGLSPRDYCQRVRIYAAAMALFDGLSISRVALESGWQDLSRFYRQFRQATGETPGRYRAATRDLVK